MNSVRVGQVILLAGGTIGLYLLLRRAAHSRSASSPVVQSDSDTECPSPDSSTPSPRQTKGANLCQVYPDPKNETTTDIDIIAIHGLDTRSPDTWTWKDPEDLGNKAKWVNWLQDPKMLPKAVERVRIFTCDWPADLLQPSDLVQKRIEEYARLLLDDIQGRFLTTSGARKDRPIFFIASCLGGIILMQALVDANSKSSDYYPVRRATRGIIFLATPFGGTSFQAVAAWAEPGLKVWAYTQGREVNRLLDIVKGPTFDVDALVRKFTELCHDKEHPCEVVTFYETKTTSLPRKVFPWLPVWLHPAKLVSIVK